jgi:uncharacterized cupin superfamily protein
MALNKEPLAKECIEVLGILCGTKQENSEYIFYLILQPGPKGCSTHILLATIFS